MSGKYLRMEKCGKRTARKIRWSIAGAVIVSFLLITYSPFEYFFQYLGYKSSNGCPLLTLTGIPCPMCGMGRSLWALIEPDPHNIFYYNPSAIFLFIIAGIILAVMIIASFFNYKLILSKPLLKLWYIPVLLIIIVWGVNILFGHHDSL
jgi:hypothetical protein